MKVLGLTMTIAGSALLVSYPLMRPSYISVGGWDGAHIAIAVSFIGLVFGMIIAGIESWMEASHQEKLLKAVQALGASPAIPPVLPPSHPGPPFSR